MSLRVREPGLFSLLVDRGRAHSRHLGVPLGGAADRAALALGNALVGNFGNEVALEVTLAGPTLEALHPTACVVFGAPFHCTINDREIPTGTTFTLEAGDVLRISGTSQGARGYLCVAGGFDSPDVLGSRSALAPVRAGDELTCRPSRTEGRSLWVAEVHESTQRPLLHPTPQPPPLVGEGERSKTPPLPPGEGVGGWGHRIRVLDGPQRDWFTGDAFFANEYEVSAASNRMGLRLKGEPIAKRAGELVSEAVAPGALQVTNDGLPVILGVDGQTIGGYPKVAHVIRADLDLLAQLRPGDRVRFIRVSADEAERAARERAEWLREWVRRLQIAERQPVWVNRDTAHTDVRTG